MAIKKKKIVKKKGYPNPGEEYKHTFSHVHESIGHYSRDSSKNLRNEAKATYTSRLRAIGNSKGVILGNQIIEAAGLNPDSDLTIYAMDGVITIFQDKDVSVNTDLSTWDKDFKKAIKGGSKPEKDMFKGIENEFDHKEW